MNCQRLKTESNKCGNENTALVQTKEKHSLDARKGIRAMFRTFLLRAASFGNRRFLGSDARCISKFFAIGMTSVTQCN